MGGGVCVDVCGVYVGGGVCVDVGLRLNKVLSTHSYTVDCSALATENCQNSKTTIDNNF